MIAWSHLKEYYSLVFCIQLFRWKFSPDIMCAYTPPWPEQNFLGVMSGLLSVSVLTEGVPGWKVGKLTRDKSNHYCVLQ